MAEQACQEAVAYDLMRDIMFDDPDRPKPNSPEFRAYALDLYAECLLAVTGKRTVTVQQTRLLPRPPVVVETPAETSASENVNGSNHGQGAAKQGDAMRNKKRMQQAQA
jgi:hypothetical protein